MKAPWGLVDARVLFCVWMLLVFCGEGVFWRKMDKFEGFCTGEALWGGNFLKGMFCQSGFYK